MTMSENGGSKVAYFLVGMGVGAIVALLFAPKSGEETRKYISGKADEGRDYVATRGKEVRQQAEEFVEKGKDFVTKGKERLADALEAGKQAYRGKVAGER
jgi:gas vesicle protein